MALRIKEIGFPILVFLIICSFSHPVHAQVAGTGIYFQAVARDNFANPAKDRVIYVESSIIQTSPTGLVVLKESHKTNTDGAGVFSISIGNGTRIGGSSTSLNRIDWMNGPFYLGLKISIQPISPAANWDYSKEFVDLGVSPFGAVPYAMYAGNVGDKLNISDTASMLAPYRQFINTPVNNSVTNIPANLTSLIDAKLNITDSIVKYVTPTQLKGKIFDTTSIYNQLSTKANLTDLNNAISNSTSLVNINNSLTSLSISLASKANTNSVTSSLSTKEDLTNKSTSVLSDGTSNTKYPSVKSVKDYVDGQISNGLASANIQDATINSKGKIKLAGDLTGTADAPIIADGVITNAKLATGIDASKITGTFSGTATSAINATNATNAVYATTAGSAQTATSASTATTATSATTAITAGDITATANTSLTSLANLNTVGTITAGTWSASTISITKGGTGATTKTAAFNALSPLTTTGDLLYASATNTANRLAIGSNGNVLTVAAGVPSWASPINTTLNLGALSSGLTNGATLTTSGSNSTLTLGVADAYNAGFMSTSNQTFGGTKTFNNDIIVSGLKFGGTLNTSNVYIGYGALSGLTTGYDNYAIGVNALNANTTGHWNVSIGSNTLSSNTTGYWNTALGDNALRNAVTSSGNTGVGNYALNASTGSYNTAIGSGSLSLLTSGNYNVAIGASSSGTITSTQSIFIGYGAAAASTTSTNETVIGYNINGLGNNTTSIGNTNTTLARVYGDLLLSSNNGAISDAGNYPLQVVGNTLTSGSASANTFISTVATGNAPFTVASTTPVANLNIGGTATALSTATNYVQASGPNPINVSTANSFPSSVVSAIINTNGRPVQITAYGDLKVQYANEYCSIRLYRDNIALGTDVMIKNLTTDGASAPFSLNYIDNPIAGSYTYYLKVTSAGGPAGTLSFGATSAPTITLLELR